MSTSAQCPRCGLQKLKHWPELTSDEKFLAERLPASAEYTIEERKKHHFCTRCWYEETTKQVRDA
jgi:hypothetical protein